jgi:peroxiredoxin-like protein
METHSYKVNLVWQHDRKGELSSPVLPETITVATPPEFPKGMAGIWSPEHLFVASINSCFMATFLAVAEKSQLPFSSFCCEAEGVLGKNSEGKFSVTRVTLKPTVVVPEDQTTERVQKILETSEKACLISNSAKSEIVLEANIVKTAAVV